MYELIIFLVVVLAISVFWIFIVDPLLTPSIYIYIMKEKKSYLFTRGKQRIIFDYLTFLNFGSHGDGTVNNLFISKYKKLDESKPYFAFDKDKHLVAVIPHLSKNAGDFGILDKIALVYPDNRVEWMNIDKFLENQIQIMNDVTKNK